MQALADYLESMRRGAAPGAAVKRDREYHTQPRALPEVVSLIRPLAEDVTPSRAWRESIRARLTGRQAHLLELRDLSRRVGQTPTNDEPVGRRANASGFPSGADTVEVESGKTLMNRR